MHFCTVCSQDIWQHSELCGYGEGFHFHLPALCCAGCDCRSLEEAHPEEDFSEELAA